jgi:hypothetical protein
MLKRHIALPTPSTPNPTSGKTTVVTVPGGLRVHQVLLKIIADTGTNLPSGNWIGDIRVKLGGKVQRLHTMAELNKINATNGTPYAMTTIGSSASSYGQIIPIFLAEPWRKNNSQQEYLAWPTTKDQLMEIEVDCNGTPSGSSPTITISATAVVDDLPQPGSDKNGVIISKVFRGDYAQSQYYDLTTLDKRDIYQAVYLQSNAGSTTLVTKAIVKAGGRIIHELPVLDNTAFLKSNELTESFDYSVVLDADDPIENGLPTGGLNDLQLRIENSAAPTTIARYLAQRLGTPE